MNFRKIFEALNISSDYYSDEVVKEFIGKYSRRETENLDKDELYGILEELSMRYVDGDDEDFDYEIQEIAEKALKKIEKGPFNESRISEAGYTSFINHIGEKDYYYDPYKKEPEEPPFEADFAQVDWEKRFFKGLDFTTKEGLEEAIERWEYYYFSDLVHDIAHDGDRSGSYQCERALNKLYNKVKSSVKSLGIDESEVSNSLKNVINEIKKDEKKAIAQQKRRATLAANKEKRAQAYADELKNTELPPELESLFTEDGFYKERRSWGVIKDYFNKPYGKALKQLWVNQFGD